MKPTMQLRAQERTRWISDDRTRTVYVIQQLWEDEEEGEKVYEWRDLPVVDANESPSYWQA